MLQIRLSRLMGNVGVTHHADFMFLTKPTT
ncbi:Uncharacterised protein [Vibrio cholerae]|nr:Uncharacterised protein [Vibrio cholerae]